MITAPRCDFANCRRPATALALCVGCRRPICSRCVSWVTMSRIATGTVPLDAPEDVPAAPVEVETPAASGLLCHHGDDDQGHDLSADCPLQVRPHGPSLTEWPHVSGTNGEDGPGSHFSWSAAIRLYGPPVGTCPVCGRPGVRVRSVKHHAPVLGGLPGRRCPAATSSPLLAIRLQLAPHRTPGRGGTPCTGAGQPPAETRYIGPLTEETRTA